MPRTKKQKSLAPIGKTMPISLVRLTTLTRNLRRKDAEWIMMSLWEKENTRNRVIDMGKIPLDDICHTCTEDCKKAGRHERDKIPDETFVRVAAATVQWLATNCGRSFYAKFTQTFEERNRPSSRPPRGKKTAS